MTSKMKRERRGGGLCCAPVSGGWRDARAGRLLFLCGGEQRAYDAAAGGLDVMGHKRWLMGREQRRNTRPLLGVM